MKKNIEILTNSYKGNANKPDQQPLRIAQWPTARIEYASLPPGRVNTLFLNFSVRPWYIPLELLEIPTSFGVSVFNKRNLRLWVYASQRRIVSLTFNFTYRSSVSSSSMELCVMSLDAFRSEISSYGSNTNGNMKLKLFGTSGRLMQCFDM